MGKKEREGWNAELDVPVNRAVGQLYIEVSKVLMKDKKLFEYIVHSNSEANISQIVKSIAGNILTAHSYQEHKRMKECMLYLVRIETDDAEVVFLADRLRNSKLTAGKSRTVKIFIAYLNREHRNPSCNPASYRIEKREWLQRITYVLPAVMGAKRGAV